MRRLRSKCGFGADGGSWGFEKSGSNLWNLGLAEARFLGLWGRHSWGFPWADWLLAALAAILGGGRSSRRSPPAAQAVIFICTKRALKLGLGALFVQIKMPPISRGHLLLEVASGFEPLYEVLQTSA